MPTPQSLAADSMIQTGYGKFGKPMSMADAAAMQIDQEKLGQAQQLRENWPAILEQLKTKSPMEAWGLLVPVMGPDNAVKVMEQLRIGENQQQMQEFITGGAGMGGAPVEGQAPQGGSGLDNASDEQLARLTLHPVYGAYAKEKLAMRREDRTRGYQVEDQNIRRDDDAAKARTKEENKKAAELRNPSEFQGKAYTFGIRMQRAEGNLNGVPEDIGASAWEGVKGAIPGGNYLVSEEYQLAKQAQEDWVTANLRKESGAVIGPDEMQQEITKYFPQRGDGAKVIEQKRQSRAAAYQGMRRMAGPMSAELADLPVRGGKPKGGNMDAKIQELQSMGADDADIQGAIEDDDLDGYLEFMRGSNGR